MVLLQKNSKRTMHTSPEAQTGAFQPEACERCVASVLFMYLSICVDVMVWFPNFHISINTLCGNKGDTERLDVVYDILQTNPMVIGDGVNAADRSLSKAITARQQK